jgi:uroporphyrinogen decarboxylase
MQGHAMDFQPDYRHFVDVMKNRRPARLPLYEHVVDARIMEKILDVRFADLAHGDAQDQAEYSRHHCRFFQKMTYDTVSHEVGIIGTLPGKTAICGGQGPIQSRSDFDAYPWPELAQRYWQHARPLLDALVAALPPGMKAVGGVGNGVFELAESLVGLEHLPFVEADDPELYADLFRAIGDSFPSWC